MQIRAKIALAAGLVALAAVSFAACPPPVYFGERITGRVVDAETKQPIAGAVIVAVWCMTSYGVVDTGPPRLLRRVETLSEEDGNYVIAAWGPSFHVPWAWLWGYDPALYFFKSGYKPERRSNQHLSAAMRSRSDWNGATIALHVFRGTPGERLLQLERTLPSCALGRGGMPVGLLDEILKERTAVGPDGRTFFENVEDLRQHGR